MRRLGRAAQRGALVPAAHFTGERGTYRGAPGEVDVALAMAYAGHMLVELIPPHDDRPSVYREAIERSGYGFHHFGIGTLDYDADLARHLEQGHELAFEAWVPTGGQVGYVDTTAELPGYVELIEMDAATDAAFTRFYAAVAGLGTGPIPSARSPERSRRPSEEDGPARRSAPGTRAGARARPPGARPDPRTPGQKAPLGPLVGQGRPLDHASADGAGVLCVVGGLLGGMPHCRGPRPAWNMRPPCPPR